MKEARIQIKTTGENVDLRNIGIFVNGKEISHDHGNTIHKVKQNGNYKIVITYPGMNDMVHNIKVSNIDDIKPMVSVAVLGSNTATAEAKLEIKATDDKKLNKVSVNGNTVYQYDSKTGYMTATAQFGISQSGNYKIGVEDAAGNVYERTERIELDTQAPKVTNFIVSRDRKLIGNSSNTKNWDYCAATIGDKLNICVVADEDIKEFGDLSINGRTVAKSNYKYNINGNQITIDLELTKDIIEFYRMSGMVNISLSNISDKRGNKDNYSNNKSLLVNVDKPEISDVYITGGTLNKSGDVIEVYPRQQIKVRFLVNKKIFSRPNVAIIEPAKSGIPGATYDKLYEKSAVFEREVVKSGYGYKYYEYSVVLPCSSIIRSIKQTEGHIKLYISNCFDASGNLSDSVIIDKDNKSANGISLVYGKVESGTLYFAGVEKSTEKNMGDINLDGFVNDYDYLLLSRYLAEKETLTEESLRLANVDGTSFIDNRDLSVLKKIIEQRENRLPLDKEISFKVYNDKNEQMRGDDLSIALEEGSDLADYSIEDDIVTIKTKNTTGNIKIKASYTRENGYEQEVGHDIFNVGNLTKTDAGFEVISENKNNREIPGDINNDGYVTLVDSYMCQLYLANRKTLTETQQKVADLYKDDLIDVDDVSAMQSLNYYNYNGLKKGDKIKLRFNYQEKTFGDYKNDSIENQIRWYTVENNDMVTIVPNDNDGTAEVTIKDNEDEKVKVTVMCRVKINENVEAIAQFNILIIDETTIELNDTEIEYDLSNLEETNRVLKATTNISNRPITWSVSDDSVVKLRINMYGEIEVVPLKVGKSEITATVDGKTEKCNVSIIATIKDIDLGFDKVEIKETQEREFKVYIEPIPSTESPVVTSENEDIVKVYFDSESNVYKMQGVRKGKTNIIVTSPSNEYIKKTVEVEVTPLETPVITDITVGEGEDAKTYKIGDTIDIKIAFSEPVKGTIPKLNINFGGHESLGETKFIKAEENNTILVYQYTIQEGDNGCLEIHNLIDGKLTDSVGKLNAKLTLEPENTFDEENELSIELEDDNSSSSEIEVSEGDENKVATTKYLKSANIIRATSSQTSEENSDDQDNNDTDEYEVMASGINKYIVEVDADTKKPELKIETYVDKDSYYLKEGDIAQVKITSNEELRNTPKVTMGGIEADVEGEGTDFVASITVTKELKEGFLEIKVTDYEDMAGNKGDDIVITNDIEEPFVIDNSGTKVQSIVLIKEKNKEYKSGDKFYIQVFFRDKTTDRLEYIKAEEIPIIKIKFGGQDAKGKLESNYTINEYTNNIVYAYTISEKDIGKISIDNILGNIEDIAGNKTNLSTNESLPNIETREVDKIEQDSNGDNNIIDGSEENEKTQNSDGLFSGRLPNTGDIILLITGILICIGLLIMCIRYLRLKKIKIK